MACSGNLENLHHPRIQPRPGSTRACAIENGCLTFPDEIPGVGEVEGRWVGPASTITNRTSDVSPMTTTTTHGYRRWLTVRDAQAGESGHAARCMNPGQCAGLAAAR